MTVTQERMDRIKLSAPVFGKFFGMNSQFKEAVLVQMKFEGSIAAGDLALGGARDALKHYFSDDSVIMWAMHHLRTRYDATAAQPFFECSSELSYNGLWQGRILVNNNYLRASESGEIASGLSQRTNSVSVDMFFPGLYFPVEEDDYVQMVLGLNENTGSTGIATRSDINFLYFEKP